MTRSPHKASRALAAAVTLTLGLVPLGLVLGQAPSTAEDAIVDSAATISTPSYASKWLAIDTGDDPKVALMSSAGQISTQPLAEASDCGLDQGSPTLLGFKGSTGGPAKPSLASFASHSIGVKEKKSGTSCYQVNATSESLTLKLGAGLLASSAYLDVELKQDALILATADGNPLKRFELQSGSNITPDGAPHTDGATVFQCNNPADSGPDSGVNDNCRWPISAPSWGDDPDDGIVFNSLELEAKSGAFSLEGGSDGDVLPLAPLSTPNASIIELVDGTLDCNAATDTKLASGDAPEVFVTRLGNADGSDCDPVPYSLDNGPANAQFLKPLDVQTAAQFVWDVTWKVDPQSGAELPRVTIDYEAGGGEVTLDWCPDATYNLDGSFKGYSTIDPAWDQDVDETDAEGDVVREGLDGIQFACLISRDAISMDGDTDFVTVHDRAYVYGDARLRV